MSEVPSRTTAPGGTRNWRRRLLLQRIEAALTRITCGSIEVILPEGTRRVFGDRDSTLRATLKIKDEALFDRIARGGGVGFGEAYVDGLWDSDHLAELIAVFHRNVDVFDAPVAAGGLLQRWGNRLLHLSRGNTPNRSRHNIAAHYDLGDSLFELFLDPTMTYSCAIFESADEPLEAAQRRKIHAVLDLAEIGPQHHILEIGCGWGGLAVEAVRRHGCQFTGITLSENQLARARRRAHEAGLSNRLRFELCDYRSVTGRFDRIVSVEMIEAVGHDHLPDFFAACERVLAPGGRAVLQAITFPDQRYENYRFGCDWLQKYIFPGGLAPSLTALCAAMTRGSTFVIEHARNIGPHYARTLRLWRENFDAQTPELERRGYDARFRRMWRYYLAYCEAGFGAGTFGDLQIALTRFPDRVLPAFRGGTA